MAGGYPVFHVQEIHRVHPHPFGQLRQTHAGSGGPRASRQRAPYRPGAG
jgi:hypothetical protein